jgi:hypothetical protein
MAADDSLGAIHDTLQMGRFTQVSSSVPGATLLYVNNMRMISKLSVTDGSWGGAFSQSGEPHSASWFRRIS